MATKTQMGDASLRAGLAETDPRVRVRECEPAPRDALSLGRFGDVGTGPVWPRPLARVWGHDGPARRAGFTLADRVASRSRSPGARPLAGADARTRRDRRECPRGPTRHCDRSVLETSAMTPAILVGFPYLRDFLRQRDPSRYRTWVLDSGAFSVANSGHTIDLGNYIATCRTLLASAHPPVEIFALDVIGNATATAKNTEAMWKAGIHAIPCFHYGEPEAALLSMARTYPKIAIGGVARRPRTFKRQFAAQVFARVWPKRIHGFGFGFDEGVLTVPFHSVDAATWEIGPCGFGLWRRYGKMRVYGSDQDLRLEIGCYLDLEARMRVRCRSQMRDLDADETSPEVRLAIVGGSRFWSQPQ